MNLEYKNLCMEQKSIMVTSSRLSKENQTKLSESLDRILRTVSPAKKRAGEGAGGGGGGRGRGSPMMVHKGEEMGQTQLVKFPQVDAGLVKRRR